MWNNNSEYDYSANSFSPEGRIFQVEYAIQAIKLGSTAIGIQTSDGVVIVSEKRLTSKLIEPSSIEKTFEIDDHIGCAMSGLIADAKTMVDKARCEAQHHWFTFNEKMSVESVVHRVSDLAMSFSDTTPGRQLSRPFGVALLFAGLEPKTNLPKLFHLDPSGTYIRCDAKAIGSANEGAQSALTEMYHQQLTLKEAVKVSLTILKQVMEEKLNDTNIEICTIDSSEEGDGKFKIYNSKEMLEAVRDVNKQTLEETSGLEAPVYVS